MDITNEIFMRALVFLLAFAGFFVARYIYKHKKHGSPLVCPIKFDCHSVVHSDYSRFLGMPLEKLGMFYYSLVSLGYFFLIFLVNVPLFVVGFLVLLSIIAFIFSLYLIFIQIFILKKGCSWCFVSATICVLIFVLNIYAYDVDSVLNAFLLLFK